MHEDASRLSIAIDGPAGAGKSTVARRVAAALGLLYLDTGAMYRAVAWAVLNRGIDPEDFHAVKKLAEGLSIHLEVGGKRVFVDGQEISSQIRTPEISNLTSPISAIPGVRARMVALQKKMGAAGGVVMEGRDIGTVVMPEADVKVFLTASLEKRAERRQGELAARGTKISVETLRADIAERDARDSSRDVAPMRPAENATVLDTDSLSVEQVIETILRLCRETRPAFFMTDKPTFFYVVARSFLRVVSIFTGGLTVVGAKNIPLSGPVILAPNHRAHVDPPLLSLISPRPFCFMAKDELFRVPVFGKLIAKLGAFPVKRGTADRAALKKAIELLKDGRAVVIFPEGTRSEDGQLQTAEKGFALIARQTGASIVPIAIEGTERMLRKGSSRLTRSLVHITIGPAFAANEKESLESIGARTMAAIGVLLNESIGSKKRSEKN